MEDEPVEKSKINLTPKEIDYHIYRRYDIRRRLGKGAYGIVWKAVDRKTNDVVAVKKIYDAFRNPTDAQRTFREITFLKAFGTHPNIITLRSIHKARNDKDIYLVFEYMDSDLHNVIKKGNILKDIHIQFIMYQLLKATKYIHSGDVVHRDQKPSNVLIDVNCHCKLADFGLARSLNHSETPNGKGSPEMVDPSLTDYVATRWYRAPEILVASKRYTKGIDMWSLGCILAEMLIGKPLFPGSSTINQVELIMNTLPKPSKEDIDSVCSGYGISLIEKAPAGPRRSIRHILKNSRKDAVDLVEKLLVFKPSKRLSAVEALDHPYVSRFHRVMDEPSMHSRVVPPLRDDVRLGVDDYRSNLYEFIRSRQEAAHQRTLSGCMKDSTTSPLQARINKPNHIICDQPESSPKKSSLPQITRSVKDTVSKTVSSINRRNLSAQELRPDEKRGAVKRISTSDSGIDQYMHHAASPQNNGRPGIRKPSESKKYISQYISKNSMKETIHQVGDGKRPISISNQKISVEKSPIKHKQQIVLPQYKKTIITRIDKSRGDAPGHLSSLKHIHPYQNKIPQKSVLANSLVEKISKHNPAQRV